MQVIPLGGQSILQALGSTLETGPGVEAGVAQRPLSLGPGLDTRILSQVRRHHFDWCWTPVGLFQTSEETSAERPARPPFYMCPWFRATDLPRTNNQLIMG